MPYHDVSSMDPESILAYYDEMEMPDGTVGFADWTQESTGAKLLKAQHPEMETFLLGKHAAEKMNCADCHMPIEMNEQGEVFHSHELVSPLENKTALSTCVQCHEDTDMVDFTHKLQARVTARETEVGNKLSEFKNALSEANASKKMSEEALD